MKYMGIDKFFIKPIAILIHLAVGIISIVSCKCQPAKTTKHQEVNFNNHPHSFITEYPITAKGKPTIAYQNVMGTVQRLGFDPTIHSRLSL